jgi:GNAT superfamily N-acetyltransferase
MKNQKVRKAAAAELPEIQAIAREVIAARYPAFLGADMVQDYLDSGQADQEFVTHQDSLFVLMEGTRIMGFAICFDDFVHVMMVRLDAQRGGYGSFLLNWCEATIKERSHHTARLETFTSNSQAIGFYRKNAWVEVKRDAEDVGVFARIWFEKELS